jgi:TPP-dependent pyruvate/acetoin dehydrogenase alpha subunit
VIFVIEDNAWGISVSKRASTAIPRNADRAASYGMPGVFVADNDVDAVYAAAGNAIRRAREGQGPTLLEIETWRLEGHFMGDAEGYRPKGELKSLQLRDPIPRYRQLLCEAGLESAQLQEIEDHERRVVAEAFEFARGSAYPAPHSAFEAVFVE